MNRSIPRNIYSFLGLYLSLVFPSLGQIHKYFGILGIFIYAALVFLVLFVLYRYGLKKILSAITERQAWFLAILTLLCLVVLFFAVYPQVNKGVFGSGSDRDEEINIATRQLLSLHYPYYQQTYLGNSFSHLPGALLLAVPFVLLGNSAYQNFFWLCVFFLLARSLFKSTVSALVLFWLLLLCSPIVMQEFLTGGDFLSNSIYIVFSIFLTVSYVSRAQVLKWKKVTAALLLGIAFSSRLNFILLLPLVFSALLCARGLKPAVRYTGLACAAFLAVTLPFYLYDPQGFSPLRWQLNIFHDLGGVMSVTDIFVPLAAGGLALFLSLKGVNNDFAGLFKHCAWVQFFLVLMVVIIGMFRTGSRGFIFSGYGSSFMFFGMLAFWGKLAEK